MEQNIDLADLNGVDILFKNDLHDLGQFVLSALEARWAETGSKARPTLHGLARIYGLILDSGAEWFEEAIRAHGLPLGATLDYARDAIERTEVADAGRAARLTKEGVVELEDLAERQVPHQARRL